MFSGCGQVNFFQILINNIFLKTLFYWQNVSYISINIVTKREKRTKQKQLPSGVLHKKPQYTALLRKDSGTGVFLWILRNFKEHFFYRTPPVPTSDERVTGKQLNFKHIKSQFHTSFDNFHNLYLDQMKIVNLSFNTIPSSEQLNQFAT